ncbi:MAG TPA: hypothetical protein VLV86_15810 [Vicinamibacterales bacterium]|nr:hypothetical protein [Vicinamibacterales bacterium]
MFRSAPLSAQAAPREFFFVCQAQGPAAAPGVLPTFYVSGVLSGPATAMLNFRAGFAQFLMERFSVKAVVACAPANTEALAQTFMTQRVTALRNTKRTVVETGWTESAEAAAPPAAAAQATGLNNLVATAATANSTAAPTRAAPATATGRSGAANAPAAAGTANNAAGAGGTQAQGRAGGGNGTSNGTANDTATEVASVLGALFGTNTGARGANGSGTNSSATTSNAGSRGQTATAGRGNGTGNTGGNAATNQNAASQISSTLTTVFKSPGSTSGQGRGAAGALPNGAVGAGQSGSTKLVVFGCGRQGEQVACVTDLTNENAKDSLVQSGDIWKDAFLVDDRGDRHQRTNGFFLNIDGEQRQQIDIAYGKTAKFILMFDNVPAKVQKVALRSSSAGLDVEEIGLLSADGGSGGSGGASGAPPPAAR